MNTEIKSSFHCLVHKKSISFWLLLLLQNSALDFLPLKKWKNILISNQVIKASFYEFCCLGAYFAAKDALLKKKKKSWDSVLGASTKDATMPMNFWASVFPTLSMPYTKFTVTRFNFSCSAKGTIPFLDYKKSFPCRVRRKKKKKRPVVSTVGGFSKNGTSGESIFVLSRRDTLAYFQEERETHN